MKPWLRWALSSCLLLSTAGCGSDDGDSSGGEGGAGGSAGTGGSAGASGAAGSAGSTLSGVTCTTEPPPGAAMPAPPKPYSGGACPNLVAGPNTLRSGGADRQFIVALPSGFQPGAEKLPVAFLWHWLAGSADDFLNIGFLQAVADELRFIAVIPEKKGDVMFTWPATALDNDARFQEELTFFDDMLACVADQFDPNLSCVSSVGVSAGALWTGQLAWARSEYLSSIISLSGGVGPGTRLWGGAAHKEPALVVWGGDSDNFILNFQDLSRSLETELTNGNHFVVECVHNCGHGVPPLMSTDGSNPIEAIVEGFVRFAVDHPYWLDDGESPWEVDGLPPGLPPFCAIGAGNAVPRTGDCTGKVGI